MQARLQEIRDRLDKASKGKWIFHRYERKGLGQRGLLGVDIADTKINIIQDVWEKDDAEFIAHARQDIPFLLDALEQSQEEIFFFREEIKEANRQVVLYHESEGITLKRLKQSQDRERVLRDAINSLIGLCENVGDFSNGNTYQGIDEGNVMAGRFIERIRSDIKALEDKPCKI